MSKDKKKDKGWVHFELEEDADELFRQAIENMDPSLKKEPDVTEPKARPKRSSTPNQTLSLDLHGMTLDEACAAADRFIQQTKAGRKSDFEITFITGKGHHSGPGGAVLPRGVHHHVKTKWASSLISIEPSPADAHIGGVPIRGHFKAKFRNQK